MTIHRVASNLQIGECPDCGKQRYLSRRDARRAARAIHPHAVLRAYSCGQFWHFGHNPEWMKRENGSELRVIGLDLSITETGIALPDGRTRTLATRQQDGDRRLVYIAQALDDLLAVPVHLAVIEDLPRHANAAGITGMVHGLVRLALLEAGVPYAVVVPATLKAFATGKGTADKTAMAMAAYKRAGAEFTDDNCCDAWWLRAAGLDWHGQPLFPLPGEQRARLAKVTWPDLPAVKEGIS